MLEKRGACRNLPRVKRSSQSLVPKCLCSHAAVSFKSALFFHKLFFSLARGQMFQADAMESVEVTGWKGRTHLVLCDRNMNGLRCLFQRYLGCAGGSDMAKECFLSASSQFSGSKKQCLHFVQESKKHLYHVDKTNCTFAKSQPGCFFTQIASAY